MSDAKPDPKVARPEVPYWDDPVYRHVSRLHRDAQSDEENDDAVRLEALMEKLIDGSISDERYEELDAAARAARRREKQERKGQRKHARRSSVEKAPAANLAELKKRIFNPHVSKENVMKAIEALPPAERRATIAGLPPGLKRKLGSYLTGGH